MRLKPSTHERVCLLAYVEGTTISRGFMGHDHAEGIMSTHGPQESMNAVGPDETLRQDLMSPVEVARISAATSRKMAKGRGPTRSM